MNWVKEVPLIFIPKQRTQDLAFYWLRLFRQFTFGTKWGINIVTFNCLVKLCLYNYVIISFAVQVCCTK